MDDDLLHSWMVQKSDLKIWPKRVWTHNSKAPPKAHPESPLETPVSFVYCSFSTTSFGGPQRSYVTALGPRPTTINVLKVLKSLQFQDYRKFQHNIRYNFMIGGDGLVYQGRGWSKRPSLPKRHIYNSNHSLYIGFIGYWHDEPPDDKLFELRDELIKIGISNGAINKKHLLVNLTFPSVYRFNFDSYIK